jgi:hypothetical protein
MRLYTQPRQTRNTSTFPLYPRNNPPTSFFSPPRPISPHLPTFPSTAPGSLFLGPTQHYAALKYYSDEAWQEVGYTRPPVPTSDNPDIALFPRKYYQSLKSLAQEEETNKIHDFCFIGSIQSNPARRRWVVQFARKHFTENSVFINTDSNCCLSLGSFDKSFDKEAAFFNPKEQANNQSKAVQCRSVEENDYYFRTMCRSKFCLCPAGDSEWSFRFYEVLMCGSIPVVETWHHTYRTQEESLIPYSYCLERDFDRWNIEYNQDIVQKNRSLFEAYHLLLPKKEE